MTIPSVIVAGTHSGSGKTTVSLALMAALRRRGRTVQGFKVGPDFLDPMQHRTITDRPGRNLDSWMLSTEALSRTFRLGASGADFAVIEGVMGLFDGRGGTDPAGSTAEIAQILDLPVVLVVEARGMARSIAALVRGFARFDPRVTIAGVVANRVGSRRHHDDYLAPALASAGDAPSVGFLERDSRLTVPSRHLGLVPPEDREPNPRWVEALADAAEATIDLDRILDLARPPQLAETTEPAPFERRGRIGVARDRAFCFYYEDNLEILRDSGAELVEFSPLDDRELPPGVTALYLGGGYPELHADRIASNGLMREAIRRFHRDGGAIYAECGGLMACARSLVDVRGREFPMWDLLPARTLMQERFVRLSYVTSRVERSCLLGPVGTEWRGHEFHYSRLEPLGPLPRATTLHGPGGEPRPDAIGIGGLVAGYAHIHFGSSPGIRPF